MSAAANTHINGWDSEPAKKGVQFANSVKVRTFEPVTTNFGVNTGNTEIVSEQNMTYENVEAAYKESRNTLEAGQKASRQQRIRSRDKKRAGYKQQMKKNLQIIRRRLEEFQRTPPDAATLTQFKGAIDQEFHRMESILQSENKLGLGIFAEENEALHQLASEIHQLQPAPESISTSTTISPEIAAALAEEAEYADKIGRGINYVEQLLNDIERLFVQKPTQQILADVDIMITQADQIIRALLGVPKTPEEREKITVLIGRLREMKGQHNQYILSSIGKKGGSRKTRKQQRRSIRYSKISKRSKRSNRMKRV